MSNPNFDSIKHLNPYQKCGVSAPGFRHGGETPPARRRPQRLTFLSLIAIIRT